MPNLLALIPISALLIVLGYVLFAPRFNKPKEEEKHTFTPNDDDWQTIQAQDLIHDAGKKADEIISAAETEGIKIAAASSLGGKEFAASFNQKLGDEANKASVLYEQFLKELEQRSITSQSQVEELLKNRINGILFNLEQNLSGFLTTSEQKSIEAINLELKSARQLIDTYKNQQLQIIDENIIAVLERTLSLVLRNKLTLKDQLDLVYDALEKAKAEKFFA
jgi:hypothetical protein